MCAKIFEYKRTNPDYPFFSEGVLSFCRGHSLRIQRPADRATYGMISGLNCVIYFIFSTPSGLPVYDAETVMIGVKLISYLVLPEVRNSLNFSLGYDTKLVSLQP